ncbi:peptidase M24, structural domain-containing protein [Cunninghamella echinulata]|nr:peptidase M24, structural domain-containing protein [Cunninghamella echinulata]
MEEESSPLLHKNERNKTIHWNKLKQKTMLFRVLLVFGLLAAFTCGVWILNKEQETYEETDWLSDMNDLKRQSDKCKQHITRIPQQEYIERQQKLATTLRSEGVQAYIMEPSATMTYYTNMTWSRTERPFLILFTLNEKSSTNDLDMTIITPLFEQTRAQVELKRANLSPQIPIKMVPWVEHGNVFETIRSVLDQHQATSLSIEPTTRLFIEKGIQQALTDKKYEINMASLAIQRLRMAKSTNEINIMRCANQLTELAIRKVKRHIKIGMTEQQISSLMTDALENYVGLVETWVVSLIDENAALPHGNPEIIHQVHDLSVVLIDTGGELYGYQSDTTRTFFISKDNDDNNKKKMNSTIEKAWYTVHQAQVDVLTTIQEGDSCAHVDLTARHVIEKDGLGDAFTHRLGHGIGMEMHEDPYMNQGNTECILQPGFTFSVEPGVYLPNEFGIRLEDIVFVNQQGRLELLTNGLAQNPWTL